VLSVVDENATMDSNEPRTAVMMDVKVGDRFGREVVFTPDAVMAFALAAGDDNPLHFDPAVALASPYGRLIVSGTHTSALLLGLTASHFSKITSVVGRRFTVEFKRAVPADATVTIEWWVVSVTPRSGRRGRAVQLEGALVDRASGEACVTARGEIVIEI
jgi:3-hydroxybutyryl-CoA dehydratase